MKTRRIKTDWAALTAAEDGSTVVCVGNHNNRFFCLHFGSLEELRQAIHAGKLRVRKWAIAVPRSLCILKTVSLPASDLAEAARMIEFELPSLVPLMPEEIVYGCTPLTRKDNTLSVLLCILKLTTLNEHLKPYSDIGIKPHRVTPDSLAIQGWFESAGKAASGARISALLNSRRCLVLTSIDGNLQTTTDVLFSDTSAPVFANVVQEVLNHETELPAAFREQAGITLAGREEYVSEIRELLFSVGDKPVAANRITIVESPKVVFDGQVEHSCGQDHLCYEATVTAGLLDVVKGSKLPFCNLLPQKYLSKFEHKAVLFNYLFCAASFSLSILLLWLCLWASNRRIEQKSRLIRLQIAPVEQIAGIVDSKRQRVKAVQTQLAGRGLITQVFQELYKYTPKNISISELHFASRAGQAEITIKGQADLLSNALEYTEATRAAKLLNRMQVTNAQQIPRPGGSVVEFTAQCDISNEQSIRESKR